MVSRHDQVIVNQCSGEVNGREKVARSVGACVTYSIAEEMNAVARRDEEAWDTLQLLLSKLGSNLIVQEIFAPLYDRFFLWQQVPKRKSFSCFFQ
jgi:hypothetical protein